MKNLIVTAFAGLASSFILSTPVYAATDWSQPPIMCIEDIVPSVPKRPCPDLTAVENPMRDLPEMPEAELQWWKDQKFAMGYCRSVEVARRENANPGTMTAGAIQIAYMRHSAVKNHEEKVNAVYNAAEEYGVPPHILTGALMQESIFSDLGVSDDGGNFSCGIAQIGLTEWCSWAESKTPSEKRAMGWPTGGVNCGEQAKTEFVRPFFEIGSARLNGLPQYRLTPRHTQNISYAAVQSKWADAPESERQIRYQAASSFLNNCGTPDIAMRAKAFVLKRNYMSYIPRGLREIETYAPGQRFNLRCQRPMNSTTYPLQTAWIMAVGTYNAGPRVKDMMASTHRWTTEDLANRQTFANFNPDRRATPGFTIQDLVSSVYHAGKYDSGVDKMRLTAANGSGLVMPWFKLCIVQRHMARIVNHVTRGELKPLVTSMEGERGCARGSGDPDPR